MQYAAKIAWLQYESVTAEPRLDVCHISGIIAWAWVLSYQCHALL